MAKTQVIKQGESLEFSFDLGGESMDGYIFTIFVKQFPSDVASITRVIPETTDAQGNTVWAGFLTQAETSGLPNTGLWWIVGKAVNSGTDEESQITPGSVRFQMNQAWA